MEITEEKLKFFKRFDRCLDSHEREELRDSDDLSDYHFGLGAWIRNTWIYSKKQDFFEAFVPSDKGDSTDGITPIEPAFLADSLSNQVLEEYQMYLKEKAAKRSKKML